MATVSYECSTIVSRETMLCKIFLNYAQFVIIMQTTGIPLDCNTDIEAKATNGMYNNKINFCY